ncbi:MAG TPA: hypothetical protein VN633_20280 [Bryobacteraceae bacterium]|nr:hypothetical protein [Bryobacteraceae bacterium]
MSPDGIAQVLLICWMAALGLLLVRMLFLGLHRSHLLFAVSCGIDLVFGIAILKIGIASAAAGALGLLGDTMDVFLTPSIAAEFYGPPGTFEGNATRQLTPLIFTLIAGIGIILFLVSGPDRDTFQSASALAFIADTLVTLFVISYVIRRSRQMDSPVDRNSLWLRRLFAVELIAGALRSVIGLFFASPKIGILDILFFAVCLIATFVCMFALRKPVETTTNP